PVMGAFSSQGYMRAPMVGIQQLVCPLLEGFGMFEPSQLLLDPTPLIEKSIHALLLLSYRCFSLRGPRAASPSLLLRRHESPIVAGKRVRTTSGVSLDKSASCGHHHHENSRPSHRRSWSDAHAESLVHGLVLRHAGCDHCDMRRPLARRAGRQRTRSDTKEGHASSRSRLLATHARWPSRFPRTV